MTRQILFWRHHAYYRTRADYHPKHLRERFGMDPHVEVEITPTKQGLLIRKQAAGTHPVERVYGILNGGNTDDYLDDVRAR